MVVFKSRKVKKVKKLKKKKTIHTKYKHHHRTLKQPKHKSYNATQSYYNVNNRLAGVQDSVSLEVSINELNTIALEIFIGNINDSLMNELLTDIFSSHILRTLITFILFFQIIDNIKESIFWTIIICSLLYLIEHNHLQKKKKKNNI